MTRLRPATNVQHRVEWPEHARATHAVERGEALWALVEAPGSAEQALQALLRPPLFQTAYLRGHGTLYTAAYRPRSGAVELRWPGQHWQQTLSDFGEGARRISYGPAVAPGRDLAAEPG